MKRFFSRMVSILTSIAVFTGALNLDLLIVNAEPQTAERYTVLLLDTSGPETFIVSEPNYMNLWGEKYTSDSSIEAVKKAAKKFLNDAKYSLDKNYIAIVGYDENATVYSDFTDDLEALSNDLDSVTCNEENDRSIECGLQCAYDLLSGVTAEYCSKNVILCTTGLTDTGNYDYTGYYSDSVIGSTWQNEDTEIRIYAYANSAKALADRMRYEDILIFVVGIFKPIDSALQTDSTSDIKNLLHKIAHDLASTELFFYEVEDPEYLTFVFGELQSDVTGSQQKRLYNDSTYYKNTKTDDKQMGSYYVDVQWGASLFEIPSTRLYAMDYKDKNSVGWNMAMVAVELSAVAYTPNLLIENYKELGFLEEDINLYGYPGEKRNQSNAFEGADDGVNAFSIASQTMTISGEETDVIIIDVRGTSGPGEMIEDIDSAVGQFEQYEVYKSIDGFKKDIFAGLEHYLQSHQDIGTRPMKILVTGHSLGGATANLVAAELNLQTAREETFYRKNKAQKDYNLSIEDIYAYTFGAIDPLSGYKYTPGKYTPAGIRIKHYTDTEKYPMPIEDGYVNIINIYNLLDNFGPVESHPVKPSGSTGKNRFGRCLYFSNDMEEYVVSGANIFDDQLLHNGSSHSRHEISGYLQAVDNCIMPEKGKNTRVEIRCPVDVIVKDGEDIICKIQNNEVITAEEGVVADVCDDVKTIILPNDQKYDIDITATDTGTMTYMVQSLSDEPSETVFFSDIELTDGKEMTSQIDDSVSSNDTTIEVVGKDGAKEETIQADDAGVEVVHPEPPEVNTESGMEEWKENQRRKMAEELNISLETEQVIIETEMEDSAADQEEWVCPECGNVATDNYCYICGAKKPSTEWICPTCGQESAGQFCSNCGTPKPEGDN